MINKKLFYEYKNYILVGSIRAIVAFSFYVLLLRFFNPLLSLTCVWLFSVPATLYLHKKYVFKKKRDNSLMIKYFLIYLITYLINFLALFIVVEIFYFNAITSQFIILFILSIISFFIIRSLYFIK